MKQNIIGTKQLRASLPQIAQAVKKGHSFMVMRHHEHLFDIVPPKSKLKKKYTRDDFAKLQFSNPQANPNTSKHIDKILYNI